MVSHDREFLARTVTRVLELDLAQQQVRTYGGGYAGYLEEREVARRHAREDYEEYADTRAGLEERARTQRAWMEKGVRNARRKAPDNDKIGRKFRAEATEKQAAEGAADRAADRAAGGRRGAAQGVGTPDGDRGRAAGRRDRGARCATRSSGAARSRSARSTCRSTGPTGSRSPAPNGSGKTTLLGALLGRIPLDGGAATLGSGVVVGEVDQARGLFLGDEPLAARVRARRCRRCPTRTSVRCWPSSVCGPPHVLRPAATLSPGERTRAALALLQARGVNLLVLDEPTNHLDLPAIEQLESALAAYPGTLLLVTHDRRMLDAVTTNRHLHVEAGLVTQ